jgi:hypothetical protein
MNNIKRFIPMISKITKRNTSFIPKENIQREINYSSDGSSVNLFLSNLIKNGYFNNNTDYQINIKIIEKYPQIEKSYIQAIKHAYCGCIEYDDKLGRFYFIKN